MKKYAQNVIEFAFVFLVIMSIFLSIIELLLYWRARHSVSNIANEIVANMQIEAQNTKTESQIVNSALNAFKKSAGLLNLANENYTIDGSSGSYKITCSFQKKGKSALVALININNLERGDISAAVIYIYSGIFLYQDGREISSGPVQAIQKF